MIGEKLDLGHLVSPQGERRLRRAREPPVAERSRRGGDESEVIAKLPLWASLLIALAAGGAFAWLLLAPGDTVSKPTRPETDKAGQPGSARQLPCTDTR